MAFVLSKKDFQEEVKETGNYNSSINYNTNPVSEIEQWNKLLENISILIDKFVQMKSLSSQLNNKITPVQEPFMQEKLQAQKEGEYLQPNFNMKKVFRNIKELENFLDNLVRGLPDNPDAKEKDLINFLLEFSREIKEFSLAELKVMYNLNKSIMLETIKKYYNEQEGVRK